MKKKKSRQWVPIIIFLLIIGALSAFTLPRVYSNLTRSTTQFFNLPRISASFTSEDGESHYVQTDLTVSIDKSKAKNVSSNTLYKYTSEIVKGLDYQSITGPNNTDYIKEQVMEGLAEYIDPEDLEGVYISALQTGDGRAPDTAETNEKRNSIFRGLFGNIN